MLSFYEFRVRDKAVRQIFRNVRRKGVAGYVCAATLAKSVAT